MAATYPCFYRYRDNRGKYYWVYYDIDGLELARSSKCYTREQDCDDRVELVKNCGNSAYFAAV
jgi:uncharacterized protein YegP (UPF0339 family)